MVESSALAITKVTTKENPITETIATIWSMNSSPVSELFQQC